MRRIQSTGPLTVLAISLLLGACAGEPVSGQSASAQSTAVERGGEIWGATCNRCHNARQPGEYSSEQWPVIVSHMRTRAHLTRSEAEDVTAFLQDLAVSR